MKIARGDLREKEKSERCQFSYTPTSAMSVGKDIQKSIFLCFIWRMREQLMNS